MRANKTVSAGTTPEYNQAMTNCYDIAKTLGLKYDGVLCGLWHQFTEMNETKSSHGASFYVHINQQTLETVRARQTEVFNKFGGVVRIFNPR